MSINAMHTTAEYDTFPFLFVFLRAFLACKSL
jgi:hypothetical protein